MKRKCTRLTDLNVDVLKKIMIHVAESSDGATNIARMLPVCRVFSELAEDREIVKAVVFDRVKRSGIHGSFWQQNGLLVRCLRSGNVTACDILCKYGQILGATLRAHRGALLWRNMITMSRARAVGIVNTRARLKSFQSSVEECWKLFDAVDVDIQKFMEF
ncbi:unnamed protein product [Ilex paraguariensis]|uniref:Uncharacterized protein n=1 Tax=Ilex paraguariensis TaxID=185542 RepID=A0ABC8T0H1_9AQUA